MQVRGHIYLIGEPEREDYSQRFHRLEEVLLKAGFRMDRFLPGNRLYAVEVRDAGSSLAVGFILAGCLYTLDSPDLDRVLSSLEVD